ncbi:MAG: hypothetical protein B6D39_04990 [Anaerolineae bacterium UTCFX2]|nr:zinc ribbon domain-containing protein [Anaerolineae bacterium]OQY92180.1 MAG: hypothetical protein B6D39_04990 [Anaerolineae bacterium UTCFX2]
MFKHLAALFFVLILSVPAGVLAQDAAPLSEVKVDLWPEFDRPSMLVIYHIILNSQTSLPFQMALRIPAAAGEPHAVAVRQPGGGLFSIPYELQTEPGWTRVIFQATTPEIQLEFYDPSLERDGNQRTYRYTWPGDYAVASFGIDVQQPKDATGMQIKPGTVSVQQGADGLMYYGMNVGPLDQGQVFEISIIYQKTTDTLSVSDMTVESSAPLEGPFPGAANIPGILPIFLGIIGFVLIAGGAFWYWKSGLRDETPPKERHRRRRPAASALVEDARDSQVYCQQCGKRALPGDQFCRACGTPLRINPNQ